VEFVLVELLLINLKPILLSVVVPFLLMALFTIIRKMYGNSVTALPDSLIFLSVVDFYFVLIPSPWIRMAHPSVWDFFQILAFILGLIAVLVFLFTLTVEKKLIRFWIKTSFPDAFYLMPPDINRQQFPYLAICTSWFFIASLVALNVLIFMQK